MPAIFTKRLFAGTLALLGVVCAASAEAPAAPAPTTPPAHELPSGFAYVHETIEDVVLDIRYASSNNFVGEPIDGYESGYAIVTKPAVRALKKAADELRKKGYRLKIFDAYRPRRAVRHFLRWSEDESDMRMRDTFYPDFSSKAALVEQGYIAYYSSHSKGSAVDLTLVDADGNELDMGTGFDFFGKRAWYGAQGLTDAQKENRLILWRAMTGHGFRAYEKEWWHFRLDDQPYPDDFFDFVVK